MKRWITVTAVICMAAVFVSGCSCARPTDKGDARSFLLESALQDGATVLYAPRYATHFLLAADTSLNASQAANPPARYLLYIGEHPQHIQKCAIEASLTRVVCLSTTHTAFLEALDKGETICGLSGGAYVYSPALRTRYEDGTLREVGYESAIDYELLLQLQPQVVFAYTIASQSAPYLERLQSLGLNVVIIPEHTEAHPLGKAEFLVAFAAFFGPETLTQAIAQFNEIAAQYEALAHQTAAALAPTTAPDALPKVLLNAPFKEMWYTPRPDSYTGVLLRDAGGQLLVPQHPSQNEGALVMSTEEALQLSQQATVWLHPNQATRVDQLLREYPLFSNIPAVQQHNVWNNTLRVTPLGGNDFFESGTVSPHLILADLTAILHPHLHPNHTFTYYRLLP